MSQFKCTCHKQQPLTEDPNLVEKLKERQFELEELILEFEHRKGNLERENLMLEENLKLEAQGLRGISKQNIENQIIQQQLTDQLRAIKITAYKKQNEVHLLVQNVHEQESEKKQLINEIEFLKQQLLHTNENQQQLAKKEEHIKLLNNRIIDLEQQIVQIKRQQQSK